MSTPIKRRVTDESMNEFTRKLTDELCALAEIKEAEERQKAIDKMVEQNLIESFGVKFKENNYTMVKFTKERMTSYPLEKLNSQIIEKETWSEGNASVFHKFLIAKFINLFSLGIITFLSTLLVGA